MATARGVLQHLLKGGGGAAACRIRPRWEIPGTCFPALADRCTGDLSVESPNSVEALNFRRFSQSATMPESIRLGYRLIQGLGSVAIKDLLHLEALAPPRSSISIEDARKLLQLAQIEALKSTIRSMPQDRISYAKFLRICEECVGGSNPSRARDLAKTMDESGSVIVLGDTVFLRPDQLARVLEQTVIPRRESSYGAEDPRRRELEEMEREKAEIDGVVARSVRRELWCGLVYLAVQTAAFMRLTFWELSWDVMEPICFYVTSAYFMAGYAFFLRTSRDPSFEGFFASRFHTKQRRLMRRRNFDLDRLLHLQHALRPPFSSYSSSHPTTTLKTRPVIPSNSGGAPVCFA